MRNGNSRILLKPKIMTGDVMTGLEKLGLVRMLRPGKDYQEPRSGAIADNVIYSAGPAFGPHTVLSVTVGATDVMPAFGMHSENEEVFFIGKDSWKPLYLIMALCDSGVLRAKLATRSLSADDFICLEVRYNDPEASFFIINRGTLHGECVSDAVAGRLPSFYVTEAKNTDLMLFDLGGYELKLD